MAASAEAADAQGLFPIPFSLELLDASMGTPGRIAALLDLAALDPQSGEVVVTLARILSYLGAYQDAARLLSDLARAQWQAAYPHLDPLGYRDPRAVPSFLIVGQGKAGTTALYSYLTRHPRIVPALTKEVEYWSYFYDAGDAWYRAHFPPIPTGSDLVTGEASTSYFIDPYAATRIAEALPAVKLILLLREPVDRAYSQYQMFKRFDWEQRSWEAVVAAELAALRTCPRDEADLAVARTAAPRHSYLLHSAALPFLQRWCRLVPREQLLILQHEDLRRDPPGTLDRVYRFLGLPALALAGTEPVNEGRYPPMAPNIEQRLRDWFQPHQEALASFLAQSVPEDSVTGRLGAAGAARAAASGPT
jgi:hypothetical protein